MREASFSEKDYWWCVLNYPTVSLDPRRLIKDNREGGYGKLNLTALMLMAGKDDCKSLEEL